MRKPPSRSTWRRPPELVPEAVRALGCPGIVDGGDPKN
jgi:hypothetical protein